MNGKPLYSLGIALLASVLAGPLARTDHRAHGLDFAITGNSRMYHGLDPVIVADFDGDRKPDVIVRTAAGHGHSLQIQFSTRMPSASLVFEGAGPGLRVISRDVNRDNDEDLIVTSCTSPIPVAIFLGDGKGHFQPDNPWNYIPSDLSSPYHYDSPAGHDRPASNTEEKRPPTPPSCGELAHLRLDVHLLPCARAVNPGVRTTGFVHTLRGPPAETNL